MAQHAGYFDDFVTFDEGPFVIVNAGGWRIEAQYREAPSMPALPDYSIYRLKRRIGWPHEGKVNDMDIAARVCDKLNAMVVSGAIERRDGPNDTFCFVSTHPNDQL